MALEKKYYSGSQVFDIIKELPEKEFLSMLNTFAKERGADAVEVVRCKDCMYHEDDEPGMVYCPNQVGGWVSEDFFCKDGERRENDGMDSRSE